MRLSRTHNDKEAHSHSPSLWQLGYKKLRDCETTKTVSTKLGINWISNVGAQWLLFNSLEAICSQWEIYCTQNLNAAVYTTWSSTERSWRWVQVCQQCLQHKSDSCEGEAAVQQQQKRLNSLWRTEEQGWSGHWCRKIRERTGTERLKGINSDMMAREEAKRRE